MIARAIISTHGYITMISSPRHNSRRWRIVWTEILIRTLPWLDAFYLLSGFPLTPIPWYTVLVSLIHCLKLTWLIKWRARRIELWIDFILGLERWRLVWFLFIIIQLRLYLASLNSTYLWIISGFRAGGKFRLRIEVKIKHLRSIPGLIKIKLLLIL